MITRRGSVGRRGWSLVDVAVAFALLAFVFLGAARFVLALADSSETAVTRAAARREIALAEELLNADFSAGGVCGPGVAASHFGAFNTAASGGSESISLYVDVNLDGEVDMVGWRVADNALQRAVVLNTSAPCQELTLSEADWDDVLTPAESVSDAGAHFTGISDGYPTVLSGSCADPGVDCSLDGVRVALATRVGTESGPVRLDAVYNVAPGI